MAAKIGDLIVELKANTAAFSTDMNKASNHIAAFSTQARQGMSALSSAFTIATRAAGVFGVAMGTSAILQFSGRALAAAGSIGELGEQLGIGTNALQGYQFAAAQTGATQEALEAGISKVTRTIGEAADGNDAAISSFRRLGISILDAAGRTRSTEAILRDAADAIAGAEDPARRGAIAFELFGRAGQRLLPIFSQGAAGIDNWMRAARDSGQVLDAELIGKADKASDAINQMTAAWAKLGQTLVSQVAPALTTAAQAVTSFLSDRNNEIERLERQLDAIGKRSGNTPAAKQLFVKIQELKAQRDAFTALDSPAFGGGRVAQATPALPDGDAFTKLAASLELQRDSIDQTGAALLRLRLERDLDEKGQKKWTAAQIDAAVAIQEQTDALTFASRAAEMYHQAAIDSSAADDRAREAARQRSDAILGERARIELSIQRERDETEALNRALGQSERAYAEEAEFIRLRNQYRAAGIPLIGEELEALRKLAAKNVEANRALDRTGAVTQELAAFGDRAFDRIGSAITEAFVNGRDAVIDFQSITKAVISEIMQEWIKLSLINPFKNWAFGQNNPTGEDALGKIFSLFGSGGAGAGASSASTGFATAESAQAFGMAFLADGTPNAPPGWAVVGEAGPELVKFKGGERVFSNADSQRLGGGQTINVYPDLRGASVEAVNALMREVRRINASIEPRIVATVMGETGRGGRMREIMG